MTGDNLLDQPVTLLPPEPEVLAALSRTGRHEIATVAAAHPTSPLAWAELADVTHAEGRTLESYAYARVGAFTRRKKGVKPTRHRHRTSEGSEPCKLMRKS